MAKFGMPRVNIQQRVGTIVIKHTQLEHVLRLCDDFDRMLPALASTSPRSERG